MASTIDVDPSMREYGENLTMQERLKGHCNCGSVRYESECGGKLWGVFYCHCSMCPTNEAESHGGVGWAAIPRPKYFGSLLEKSSSNFATRGVCIECNGAIFIRYHCEDYTDWVLYKTLHPKPNHTPSWHIHCKGKGESYDDTIPATQGWECWDPDPCRPNGSEPPSVCFRCFLTSKDCKCSEGMLIHHPRDS